MKKFLLLFVSLVTASVCFGQYGLPSSPTYPFRQYVGVPGTCVKGETIQRMDLPAGSNLFMCDGANNLVAIGGSTVAETRPLLVQKVKPSQGASYGALVNNLAANGTTQIASVTGAGNLVSIQVAMNASTPTAVQDSTIQVIADGSNVMNVPIGLLYLLHGENPSLASENILIGRNSVLSGCGTACSNGGWAAVNIPYSTSLVVNVVNADTSNGVTIFTQVEYYSGAAPTGLYNSRRGKFHANVVNFTSMSSLSTLDILPLVTLATGQTGTLDSIRVMAFSTVNNYSFLEGHPRITVDGVDYIYGGTEDFFGGQYYFANSIVTSEWGGSINTFNTTGGGTALYGFRGYRFFNKRPVVFNSSLRITLSNGTSNEGGSAPPAINLEALVIWYSNN